jgi:peroxiredoxin
MADRPAAARRYGVETVADPAPRTRAPSFALPSTTGGSVALDDLVARGPAVVVFASEECPTCGLALRRLAPIVAPLQDAGVGLAVVFEDPLDVAARVARDARFRGTVLAEPAPYETSRAYELESLPTTVLLDGDGCVTGTVVGWDAAGLSALVEEAYAAVDAPAPAITDEAPRKKPGCAAKSTYDDELLALIESAGAADEMEDMFERGWTDGLPVVPPTRARVDAMLAGRDPARSLGDVPPGNGEATLERVAACAVLAGCRPEYFPVVVAAVEAALDPAFNLNGQAVTTQPAGQLVIVGGPVAAAIGVHSGMGVLGPGFRANLTIGRALRLVVALTGGGMPGRLDRSTLGNPGKLGFCIAEDEAGSPWEPLHVERGFAREDSVVTVVGCDAPLSISDHRATTPEELAEILGWAGAATWSPNWWPLGGASVYVICPEHQAMFGAAGWSRRRLREAMFTAVRKPARELRRGETTPRVHAAEPDALITKWDSPDDIVLLAAGGEAGRYSAVLGPCLGMNTQMVSREVAWST